MKLKSLVMVGLWFFVSSALSQSWTIGNAQIERKITFDPHPAYLRRSSPISTHYLYIATEKRLAAEFSFACNGETLTGASSAFELVRADESKLADGTSLTIHLQSKSLPLEVSVVYRAYNGHPAIRKWLLLKNTGSTTLLSLI